MLPWPSPFPSLLKLVAIESIQPSGGHKCSRTCKSLGTGECQLEPANHVSSDQGSHITAIVPMTGREASSLECCLDSSTGIRNAGCLTWRGEIKPWRAGFQGFLGICSTPGGRGRSLLDGFLGVSRWSGATEGEAGNAVTNTQFFPRREDTAMLLSQPSFSVSNARNKAATVA